MYKNSHLVISCLVALGVTGCGGFRAFPESPFDTSGQLNSAKFAFEEATFKQYYNEGNSTKRVRLRNRIINAQIRAYDIKFGEYEQNLFQLGIGLGVGTNWASLALSGLTATVGGTTTKAAFGAINAGIVGAKGALDKHLFMEKTLPVILTEISSQRAEILLQIRIGLLESDSKYSLDQGLSDMQRYKRAGSIASALNGIVASSGSKLKNSTDKLSTLITGKFKKDAAGNKLRTFWTKNAVNARRLKSWMTNNGLTTNPGDIPIFLRDAGFADLRAKAVKDLKL